MINFEGLGDADWASFFSALFEALILLIYSLLRPFLA